MTWSIARRRLTRGKPIILKWNEMKVVDSWPSGQSRQQCDSAVSFACSSIQDLTFRVWPSHVYYHRLQPVSHIHGGISKLSRKRSSRDSRIRDKRNCSSRWPILPRAVLHGAHARGITPDQTFLVDKATCFPRSSVLFPFLT